MIICPEVGNEYVVRTTLFLGHIAFQFKSHLGAVKKKKNSVEYKNKYLFLTHFACQQIQGCFVWVLLFFPHTPKEQLLFGIFHSSDREEVQEGW